MVEADKVSSREEKLYLLEQILMKEPKNIQAFLRKIQVKIELNEIEGVKKDIVPRVAPADKRIY